MTDVNPYTLGIRTADDGGNCMSVVIPRNVTIPVTRTKRYSTCSDYQTEVIVEVYQGESRIASHNRRLGQFHMRKLPPRPAGQEKLDVSFSYDLNGLLKVSAILLSTGSEKSIEIDLAKETERAPDLSGWKDAPGAKAYRALIRTAERLLSGPRELPEHLRDDLREALDDLKQALIDGEDAEPAGEELQELVQIAKEDAL